MSDSGNSELSWGPGKIRERITSKVDENSGMKTETGLLVQVILEFRSLSAYSHGLEEIQEENGDPTGFECLEVRMQGRERWCYLDYAFVD